MSANREGVGVPGAVGARPLGCRTVSLLLELWEEVGRLEACASRHFSKARKPVMALFALLKVPFLGRRELELVSH